MDKLFEKQLDSTNVFRGKLLDVYSDSILLPNGNTSKREYIKHNGAACVVPVDKDNNVIVTEQFRYPFGKVLTEIPAGKLDSKDEPHLDAALRELKEETGYTSENVIYLGEFYGACAYTNEIIHMYLATDLKEGEQKLDADEFLNVKKVPLEKLVEEIMQGNIPDGKTQTAILKAYMFLNKK